MNSLKFTMIDYRIAKGQIKMLGFFFLVGVAFSLYIKSPLLGMSYMCFGSIVMSMVPFNLSQASSNGFLNMLPATALSRVIGRYLFSVMMSLAGVISGILCALIVSRFTGESMPGIAIIAVFVFLFSQICQCIQYLMAYVLMPYQSQQVVIPLLRMVPAFLFWWLTSAYMDDLVNIANMSNLNALSIWLSARGRIIAGLLLTAAVAVIGIVSVLISWQLIEKRDMGG